MVAINKELDLRFVLAWTIEEFRESLEHIEDGRFDVSELVTRQVALDQVADTFAALANPEGDAKVVVEPWSGS